MKYLQIWHGEPFPEERIECIESVKRFIEPDDEYVFIGDKENSNTVVLYDDYVNDVILKDSDKSLVDLWNYYDKEIKEERGDIYAYFNYIRFYYASKNDDVFYLDTDIYLKDFPDFKDNKPYFGKAFSKIYDIYIFYSGKNKEFFNNILLDTQDIPPKKDVLKNILTIYYRDKIVGIDDNYFDHRSLVIDSPKKLFESYGLKFGENNGPSGC